VNGNRDKLKTCVRVNESDRHRLKYFLRVKFKISKVNV
jgi:hypothetical protein